MPNPYRVRAAFEAWREELGQSGGGVAAALAPSATATAAAGPTHEDLLRLQRENSLLVDALRQTRGRSETEQVVADIRRRAAAGKGGAPSSTASATSSSSSSREHAERGDRSARSSGATAPSSSSSSSSAATAPSAPQPSAEDLALARVRAASFDSFRRSYRKNAMVEEQKSTHAAKVEQARAAGERINDIRNRINATKQRIEARRLARGVAALAEGGSTDDSAPAPADSEESRLRAEIDSLKHEYRAQFEGLKHLKGEIDYLRNVVERSRAQLQADFERWWATQPQAQGAGAEAVAVTNQQQPEYFRTALHR